MTSPAALLAHTIGDARPKSDAMRLVRAYRLAYWLRSGQCPPPGAWRSWGIIAGRGFGKTFGIAVEMNRRVETGECKRPALMAPTLRRVDEVQTAAIVATSPPWFRAETYGDHGVRWPNGVVAEAYSPEAPGRSRSGNFDFVWLTEVVDWLHTSRWEAFTNITTACRIGCAQYVWDTTSRGKNNVIQFLTGQHEADPELHQLSHGTMFDNPFLSDTYLRDTAAKYARGSRRYREEVLGEVFAESAGALWQQHWLDDNRVAFVPDGSVLTVLGCDPALSDRPDADETGLVRASRDATGHVYIERDLSGRYPPEKWGDLIVSECMAGAAGVVIETNHMGKMASANVRARAKERGQRVEVLPTGNRATFPRRVPGTIVIREVTSRNSKGARAQPVASLYESGRVHHAGILDELELELTTWEPDTRQDSPNRLDALCEAVNELAETLIEKPPPNPNACSETQDAQRELNVRLSRRGGRRYLGI